MMKPLIIFVTFAIVSNAYSQTNFWRLTNGPNAGWVLSLHSVGSSRVLAGTWQGLYQTTDRGNVWTPTGLARSISCIVARNSQDILIGTDTAGVFRSTDGGSAWRQLYRVYRVAGIAFKNSDTLFVIAQPIALGSGFWRSVNGGTTWEYLGDPWLSNRLLNAIIVGGNGVLFVATHGYGIYRSSDNGSSWYASNIGLTNGTVYELFQSSNGTMFAGTTDGMFASTDAGGSWQRVVSSQNGVYAFAENAAQTLFAATAQQGVLVSTDNGSSWLQRNEGLPYLTVFSVAVDDAGYVYAGTASDSVSRTTQPTVSVDGSGGNLPRGFSLAQNYPNPFNPTTTIEYQLRERANVELSIYNSLGQLVRSVVTGEAKEAGNNVVTWDGRSDAGSAVSSGAYFYQVKANGFVQTKRMILLR